MRVRRAPPRAVRIAALAALAAALLFAAAVASAREGLLSRKIRHSLIAEVRRQTGADFNYRTLSVNPFKRVVLTGIEISRDLPESGLHLAVSIERLEVNYSLLDFVLRRKEVLRSLERVSLVRPFFSVTQREPARRGGVAPTPAATVQVQSRAFSPAEVTTLAAILSTHLSREKLPPLLASLADGRARYTDRRHGFVSEVDQLNGTLDLSRPNPAADLSARISSGAASAAAPALWRPSGREARVALAGTYDPAGPHFRATLTLTGLDLASFGPLLSDLPAVRLKSGTAQALIHLSDGDLKSPDLRQAVRAKGNLLVKDGEIAFPKLGRSLTGAEAKLVLDGRTLSIPTLRARWGKTLVHVTRGTFTDLPDGPVDLRVETKGLDLEELSALVPPLSAFAMSGATQTVLSVTGRLSDPKVSALVSLPSGSISGVDVTDTLFQAVLDRAGVRLRQCRAVAFGGRFAGQGNVSFQTAVEGLLPALEAGRIGLDFDFRLDDVSMRELSELGGFADLTGRADLRVRIGGTAAEPRIAGEMSANRIFVRGQKMESLAASFDYDGSRAKFEASTSDRTFTALGVVPTGRSARPSAGPPRPFDVTLDVNRYPLASLVYLAKVPVGDHKVGGLASGTPHVGGLADAPVVRGGLRIEEMTFDRHAIPSLVTEFRYEHDARTGRNDVVLERLELDQGAGRRLSMEGSANLGGAGRVQIGVRCERIDLTRLPIPEILSLAGVEVPVDAVNGSLSGTVDVTGALTQPRIEAGVRLEHYAYAGVKISEAEGAVGLERNRLTLRDFTIRQDPSGLFHARGEMDLATRAFSASVSATDVEIANFPQPAAAQGLSGRVNLEVEAIGTVADPKVRLHLWTREVALEKTLRLDADARLSLDRDRLSIESASVNLVPLQLAGRPSYTIALKGTVPISKQAAVAPGSPLDVTASFRKAELYFLTLVPGIRRARGTAEGRLRVYGRFDDPRWDGELSLSDVLLEPPMFVRAIQRLNGACRFTYDERTKRNVLRLAGVEAAFERGRLRAHGQAAFDERFRPVDFRFFVHIPTASDAIAAELPGIARIERLHGTLVLSGDPKHVVISTRPDPARDGVTGPTALHLSSGRVTFPTIKTEAEKADGHEEKETDLSFLHFKDFTVIADREVVYYNEFGNVGVGNFLPGVKLISGLKLLSSASADVVVRGDLTFNGPLDELTLSGFIRAERGTFTVLDTDFRVRSGSLRFDPVEARSGRPRTALEEAIGGESLYRLKFQMKLAGEGLAHAPEVKVGGQTLSSVKVTAQVAGHIANPESPLRITLTSDPPFTQNQIVSVLLFGSVVGVEEQAFASSSLGGADGAAAGRGASSEGLKYAATKLGQAAIHGAVNTWLLADFERAVRRATGFDLIVKTSVLENLWRAGSDPVSAGNNRSAIWSGTGIEMRRYLSDDLFVNTKFNMVSPLAMISGIPGAHASTIADQRLLPNFEIGVEYRTDLPGLGNVMLTTHENLFEWYAGWAKTIQF